MFICLSKSIKNINKLNNQRYRILILRRWPFKMNNLMKLELNQNGHRRRISKLISLFFIRKQIIIAFTELIRSVSLPFEIINLELVWFGILKKFSHSCNKIFVLLVIFYKRKFTFNENILLPQVESYAWVFLFGKNQISVQTSKYLLILCFISIATILSFKSTIH